ncbi:MAG: sugar phosphate isomerase/epimerase family protein [Pirellulaceae bacterium]
MFKNLNTAALGVTGRQSELIELALTYGFGGVDLDMGDILKRARTRGLDNARRFVASAGLRVGEFPLPLDVLAEEVAYRSGLVELSEIAEIAAALGATACTATIRPYSGDVPYHENFEMHRRRFAEIGDILAGHQIKLGLAFCAAAPERAGQGIPFIHQAETLLTLLRTVGNPHVGLTVDTWDWFVGGGSLNQLRQCPPQQIVAARFADFTAVDDTGLLTSLDRVLPGDGGAVDGGAILRWLAEQDFAGPVTLYPHPSCFRGMTRDAIVQQASARFDALYRAAGIGRTGQLEPHSNVPDPVQPPA